MENTSYYRYKESLQIIFGEDGAKKVLSSQEDYNQLGINLNLERFDQSNLVAIFVIKQVSLFNGFILNNKQLHARAKEVISMDTAFKIYIRPLIFEPPYKDINITWIE